MSCVLALPSSSRFGDLLPTISYLRASQGRRAVKIPTERPLREGREGRERLRGVGRVRVLFIGLGPLTEADMYNKLASENESVK